MEVDGAPQFPAAGPVVTFIGEWPDGGGQGNRVFPRHLPTHPRPGRQPSPQRRLRRGADDPRIHRTSAASGSEVAMTRKSTAILFFLLASIALPQAVAYELTNTPVRWFDADLPRHVTISSAGMASVSDGDNGKTASVNALLEWNDPVDRGRYVEHPHDVDRRRSRRGRQQQLPLLQRSRQYLLRQLPGGGRLELLVHEHDQRVYRRALSEDRGTPISTSTTAIPGRRKGKTPPARVAPASSISNRWSAMKSATSSDSDTRASAPR